ncbi:helix-turn-helix domain-containing protein [Haloplasma contractile]|uniref:Homoserine kinase type II protein n=1 Tax=Haloplasma contractile SSD-17B TaxID=1033810 RepID=U2FFH5_9MOLU|nr:helix-turn-helix domain-containing protein [Haloplasma contractile]ERJ11670.1 homoserine kinase type II protein [Haloplasma contractile SSD-17B]
METIDILQETVDYIEERLKTDITADELSKFSGYSVYHLYHLFRTNIGMSLFSFITKRRLLHALYETQSGEKLISVCLNYGFDTHAGFYKAFKRQFGCSPTRYLQIRQVSRPKRYNLREELMVMLTQAQVRQKINNNWDIKPISSIENGEVADKKLYHLFHINDQYIFKAGKNISDIMTHIQIARFLNAKGIQVSSPVTTRKGEDFIITNDGYEILLNKVIGKTLSTEERYVNNRIEIGKQYGIAIGYLHQALNLENYELDVPTNNIVDTMINWALPETKLYMKQWEVNLPEEFYNDCTDHFRRLVAGLKKQVVHRDIHPSNIIFNKEKVSGFIDFEISERNVRIFDPCYCATGMLSEAELVENGYEHWLDLFKGIMTGYHAICPLTVEEKQSIIYIIYSIQCVFIAWLGDKEEYRKLSHTNRKMLYWLYQNKNKIQLIIDNL